MLMLINWNLIDSFMFKLFMSIMIDVKLTPIGFDRLPVCMSG